MRVKFCFIILMMPLFCLSQARKLPKTTLKFGDIKEADFQPQSYDVDTSASAVVLADIGESKFEGNNDGFFSIVFRQHKRIRIMNKNGFDNATISIPIYVGQSGKEERLDNLEAYTYNLENGKVVATKLEKESVFKDKINKSYVVKKFTFPNIKPGSILEYRYTVTSPYYSYLRNWEFQGSMPRLWSEYSIAVPAMFDYVLINQGYRNFDVSDAVVSAGQYNILVPGETATDRSEVVDWKGNIYENVWAVKNMPALKNESFTTTVDNHIQKIDFQLRSIRWPSGKVDDIMGSWSKLAEDLMKDPDFGADIEKNNSFFQSDINKAIGGATTDFEKAKKIYAYVRDNFTCTDYSAKWLSNPLKKTFQSRSGNVADLNLLLTAIYKSNGFEAEPVLLSTKDHGKAYELYPLINKFNYVITRVKVGDDYYLLDASHNKLGFGKLPENTYNGYARIIQKLPTLVDLSPDSLIESKITSVFIMNDEKSGMSGSFTSNLGYFESYGLREKMNKVTKEDFFKDIKKEYSFETKIENGIIDSLKSYEDPVVVKYDFKFSPEEDIIYLNPMLTEATKTNPFVSAERQYPIEMPYAFNETYVLNMEIPKGYKVDELPKSTRIKLNEDEGLFEYIITANGTSIQFRSKIIIKKATFSKEDYEALRNFFAMIVKKHSEQIVLKKVN